MLKNDPDSFHRTIIACPVRLQEARARTWLISDSWLAAGIGQHVKCAIVIKFVYAPMKSDQEAQIVDLIASLKKYAVLNCSFSFNDYPSNSEILRLTISGREKIGENIHGTD